MRITQIRKMVEQEPFRAFALKTQGGTWVPVARRQDVRISPYQPFTIIVFAEDGTFYAVEPTAVVATKSL